jgi:hypothetical protein
MLALFTVNLPAPPSQPAKAAVTSGKRYRLHPFGAAHSEQFEQAPSFTRPGIDGFKSPVRLGTVADRKTEAGAECGTTISYELFFV